MPDLDPHPAVRSPAALGATAAVFILLAARQQAFVHRYAVDVLYWDAWDLYQPLFRGQGWWASFDLQHGPHRQGLGGWLMRATAELTRWDTRADAAAVSWILIAAVPLGVWLAWRCGVRGWPLAAVPVIYLNSRQYTMFIAAANPAHGALPVLLLTLYALAWFARRTAVRLSLLVLLTACLIFTGFGLFVGLLTPPLLVAEGVVALRRGDRQRAAATAVALAATLLAWAAFAHGYRPDPASDQFRFPIDRPIEYLYFIGVMLANAVGVGAWQTGPGWGTIVVGWAVMAIALWATLVRGRLAWRNHDPASIAICCLSTYGLIFATQAAIGRAPQGWQTGAVPRYVTLCIPTLLALLIHFGSSPRRSTRRVTVLCGGLLAIGTVTLHQGDQLAADALHAGCLRWRAAYLATGDQAKADRLARFPIYPKPDLGDRLAYLRRNRLNLFDPAGESGLIRQP